MAYKLKKSHQDSDGEGMTPKKMCLRVEKAAKARKDAHYDETWSKLIKLYSNQYDYPELAGYEDVIAPNMVFSTVNVIVPSIAINYPKITVTARRPEHMDAAAVVEGVSNYYWRHFDVHDEFRDVVKDFVIIGHGWVKVTWAFSEKEVEMSQDEWKQAVMDALMESRQAADQAKAAGLDIAGPSDDEIVGSLGSTRIEVVEDHPAVERVSPFDVFVDPTATRLKDARWIAQRSYVPLEVARKNDQWDAKARQNLKAVAVKREEVDVLRDGESRPEDADHCVVWEYYDLVTEEMCIFSEGCEYWLVKPDASPFAFVHPFVMVSNYSVPEKFYPIGDVETVAPLQQELALTRTQMINDRKRGRRMYLARPDEIGDEGMNAIYGSDDNAIIEVESDRPFSDLFAQVTTSSLPPEWYNQSAMILEDINLVSGVNEYQRGNAAEIRRTATEASMIQDASNARSADKLSVIERAIGEVAQRVVQLAQQFLTSEQVAKINGPDGAVEWVPYDREAIKGEFDFEVEAGSTQPQNETQRRQSALQLMDTMGPFIDMGVINPMALADHVLKNGFGVKNTEMFLQAPPPPPAPEPAPVSAETVPPGGMAPPMPQGPMPQGGMPPALPPELAQLPPEMIQMLMQAMAQGQPPVM